MEGESRYDAGQNESLSSSAVCSEANTNSNSKQDILSERLNHSFHNEPHSHPFTSSRNALKETIIPNKNSPKNGIAAEDPHTQCKDDENYCRVDIESLTKLKDSTKKLLILLEEIQSKTYSKNINDDNQRLTELIRPIPKSTIQPTASDIIGQIGLKQLESQAKTLEAIHIKDEDDDCSVYKRLIRKCNCLNRLEYNDFIIHFNEDTKFFTNYIGEIIKNMRILKKFLYMGGNYTKRALMFLNEGLSESSRTEKTDIIQGCSYADVCNIFDEHSIVTICIAWPCKHEFYGDSVTQDQASELLYKLAQIEEGRRYLKFTSKMAADIKKVLRKKSGTLEPNTLDCLNATLNLINPPLTQHINVTYYCKADEGFANKTIAALEQYRQYMTLDEVLCHLELFQNMSNQNKCHEEITPVLPALLVLYKKMLLQYDNNKMNIIITNTLNNIVTQKKMKPYEKYLKPNEKIIPEAKFPQNIVMENVATDMKPIITKNVTIQIPARKPVKKVNNKLKQAFCGTTNKFIQPSLRKVPVCEPPCVTNRSTRFSTEARSAIIVLPLNSKIKH